MAGERCKVNGYAYKSSIPIREWRKETKGGLEVGMPTHLSGLTHTPLPN